MIAYCKECGKQFRTHPSRIKKGGGKYCSIKCSQKNSIFKKENRHGRVWNSGPKVKKENKYSARQFRQREIQKAITRGFKKDCCEVCGVDNCELFLHHIVPLKLGGRSIKINCITVCRKCHSKVHTKLSSKLLEYFDDKQGELYEVLKSTVTDKYNTYWVSFIEEGILNPDYEGYVGGRVEVRDDINEYAIEEIRFFTNKKSWNSFRNKWDFREVTKKQLDSLKNIIEDKYV